MKKKRYLPAIAAALAVLTAGCTVNVPIPDTTATPSAPVYRDYTTDEQDLNDEAFDMAWDTVVGYDSQLQAEACAAVRNDKEAMWRAFDEGSDHMFSRDVFERGINRHCL